MKCKAGDEMASFSVRTKNELSKIEIEDSDLARAELAGIVQISAYLNLIDLKNLNMEIGTENASTARRVYNLIKHVYSYQAEVEVRKNKNLKKTNRYVIILREENIVKTILDDIGIIEDDKNIIFNINNRISYEFKENNELSKAFLRGAFLGAGSISNPEKMYHLEFITNDHDFGKDLLKLLNEFNLNARSIERKEYLIIYIKEGEKVADLLYIIGANKAFFKIQDIRIIKEMRNNVNRAVNCETANLIKTVNAAIRQRNSIKFIKDTIGLERLPENLRETAKLRLENKEMSLIELGNLHRPKVGKSGVNHRLRKLEEIADKLKEEQDIQ